jgi:hypothetical protein
MTKGFSLLIIVLLIGSAALALAVSSVWLGVSERELAQVWSGAADAKLLAEGCVENALWRLKVEPNYSGETLSQSGKSCIINITKTGSPITDATLVVTGTVGDYSKIISATLKVTGQTWQITSWSEN